MSLNIADLQSLSITSGNSSSLGVSLIDDAYGISIMAPATLTASQVTIQVAMSSIQAAVTLLSGGTAVTMAAGQGLVISPLPYRWLYVLSTAAEAAARTFPVGKVVIV